MAANNRDLLQTLKERVLIFDGAMGTAIHARNLTDDDFWGKRAAPMCSPSLDPT